MGYLISKFINFKFVTLNMFKAKPIINNDPTHVISAITRLVRKGSIKLASNVMPP